MICLLLAIFSSALISIGMRTSEKYISNNISMLAVNYMTCSLIAAFYTVPAASNGAQGIVAEVLLLGLISGVFYLASFVLFQWNVSKNGVVLSATFMKLGVLVPVAMSILVFREIPGVSQVIGFAGALAAILLIHFEGGGTRVESRWALIILLLGGGMADAMSKVFEELCNSSGKDLFLLCTFCAALVLCVVLICIKKQCLGRAEFLFGLVVGIPNYFSSRFLLLCLETVPAVVAFPTFSVGTIVVVSCAGRLLFKERLSRRRAAALGMILVSLVLLNV